MRIDDLTTPCLLLDREKLRANAARMAAHIEGQGALLRPHVKTHKSLPVWDEVKAAGNVSGATVSTLAEAEAMFTHGERDLLYAVGIAPIKFEAAARLIERGCALKLITDNVEVARRAQEFAAARGVTFRFLIEVDVDGHRAGVDPDGDDLLAIADILSSGHGTRLVGVMAHAGGSYGSTSPEELHAAADAERDLIVNAANRLRDAGHPCSVTSIGATPTALTDRHLDGVTEVRPGVYVFFDLMMKGLGVCREEDIAISVLSSVIGQQQARRIAICDAGWMALSRDRGTLDQDKDYAHGQVCQLSGEPIGQAVVMNVNQEHGLIGHEGGGQFDLSKAPVGNMIRILPIHACATASRFDVYHVIDGDKVVAVWPRISGWTSEQLTGGGR